ncbi:integral membrane protein [Myriangium duriaei CBS 260.36]|uniref:Integral membrane protein n=1 Tax=Myriangium duriaei CBS 260.36 TaxID=1168546 RepID=A0A9P4MP13_9PEZI|nr:integral membrane protein [Myriangium duriaei CBS 260.36]
MAQLDDLVRRHPLQRLHSPSRGASAFVHVAGLASNAFSFHWLITHPNRINQSYGWHFQYLTIVGLTLTTLTFALGLLADLTLLRPLFALKNILSIASAPMEVLITLLYWGLRSIDPALVQAPDLPTLPLAADCSFHLFPALALLADLLLFSPPYGIAVLPAFGLSSVIAVAYYFWVEHCYAQNGFYPYPLFDQVGFEGRAALFIGSALVMGSATWALKRVYGAVNGWQMDGAAQPGVKAPRKSR